MAAPLPTTYAYSVGTAIGLPGVNKTTSGQLSYTELSGGSYARKACGFTGTAISGLTQNLAIFVVATAPTPAVPILYGMIFDTSTLLTGNLICYWELAQPYTTSLTAYPATTFNLVFNSYVASALNLALQGGDTGALVDAGAQIGTMNGQPLIAGCRLAIGVGGTLVPHQGKGSLSSNIDVQNSVYFGSLGSNSTNNPITALSGGGSTGAPVLTGFFNRIGTCATSLDSAILPAAPTGSILHVVNNGAQTAQIFADTGGSINTASTTTFNMTAGTAVYFNRITSALWSTVPQTAS